MKRLVVVAIFALALAGVLGALGWFFLDGYGTQAFATKAAYASFNGNAIDLEVATSTEDQERGLSGRMSIPDDYGMLFVFQKADRWGFWMKDMKVPIDMYWLSDKGAVVYLQTDVSPDTYPNVFYPSQPVRYVLETRAGYGREHRIRLGSALAGLTFFLGVSQ